MSSAEKAQALKAQGNKAFAEHDWPSAVGFYTKAIESDDTEPTFYCNRAQVRPETRRLVSQSYGLTLHRQISSSKRMGSR